MRPLAVGFAVVLMLWAVSPSASFAPSSAAAAPKPDVPTVSKDVRAKGMAVAPGLAQAAGLDCQVSDARFIGENKDPKTKTTSEFYEVACSGNEGVIMDKTGDAPPQIFTCAETAQPQPDGKPNNLLCILPGNLDPKAGLVPYVQKAGIACAPVQIRALGHSSTTTVFELKCQSGDGYILETSAPPSLSKPSTVEPCIAFEPTMNVHCELTDRAAQLAIVDKLASEGGKPCTIKDRRFVGASATTGALYYEVACQDGKGYMIQATSGGALKQMIDCGAAEGIGGGCTLTNARAAETAQAGLYSQLARKAGFNCEVSKYAPLPVASPNQEVVELACSNRPDGAIALFPTTGGGAGQIIDCAHSELKAFRCSFTPMSAAYPKLTDDLKTLGKSSCTVSNARTVGVSPDQQGYIEVACSDGLPGFIIQYSLTPFAAKSAVTCSEAARIAGGCTLPGNTKKG